jgi:hypothetical protein
MMDKFTLDGTPKRFLSVTFGPSVESYYAERNYQPKCTLTPESTQKPEMVPDEMILPDELVRIIREFSRPLLRYIREYKEAMTELGLQDWPELKAKLSTTGAEEVRVHMHSYVAARRLDMEAEHQYTLGVGGSNVRWAKAHYNAKKAYTHLTALL